MQHVWLTVMCAVKHHIVDTRYWCPQAVVLIVTLLHVDTHADVQHENNSGQNKA